MANTIPMLDLMFFLHGNSGQPASRRIRADLPQAGSRRREYRAGDRGSVPSRKAGAAIQSRSPVFRKIGLPEWREVESVDPSHHVIHLALPAPESNEQLHELIADLHAPMLERHRPGWKLYVIEGLEGGHGSPSTTRSITRWWTASRAWRSCASPSRPCRAIAGSGQPSACREFTGHGLAPAGMRAALEREARSLAKRTLSAGRGSLLAFSSRPIERIAQFSR